MKDLLPTISYFQFKKLNNVQEVHTLLLGTPLKPWAVEELKKAEKLLGIKIYNKNVSYLLKALIKK